MTDELRTERLILRAWRPGDRAPFATLNADPVVMEHFPSTLNAEQSDAMVDRIEVHFDAHGFGFWALEHDGRFLGFTGLQHVGFVAAFTPGVEVGWRLARDAWGQGYASEAATAALAYGLQRHDSIVSFTAVTNVRSQRVMRRIGMTYEGEFDNPRLPEGDPLRRHVLYRIRAS